MNVASLENCKELYELSGWEGTEHQHYRDIEGDTTKDWVPAYDLGYLMRKLPGIIEDHNLSLGKSETNDYYDVAYLDLFEGRASILYKQKADTPEDAACKLAIELFKQGVLKKGDA